MVRYNWLSLEEKKVSHKYIYILFRVYIRVCVNRRIYFMPWNTTVDNRCDNVLEYRIPIEIDDKMPNIAMPRELFLCNSQTMIGVNRYNCISMAMPIKYGAHCCSNGSQFEMNIKFDHAFSLHKCELCATRLPHCGPLPICSKIHAANSTTAANGNRTRMTRLNICRSTPKCRNFSSCRINERVARKPLTNSNKSEYRMKPRNSILGDVVKICVQEMFTAKFHIQIKMHVPLLNMHDL